MSRVACPSDKTPNPAATAKEATATAAGTSSSPFYRTGKAVSVCKGATFHISRVARPSHTLPTPATTPKPATATGAGTTAPPCHRTATAACPSVARS